MLRAERSEAAVFYVVLLAMVAAFLALRLYMVLGKRTGHEQQCCQARPRNARRSTALPRDRSTAVRRRAKCPRWNIEQGAKRAARDRRGRARVRCRSSSSKARKSAYRMMLEAFWKGDEETLTWLVEPDVAGAFGDAIAARREAGETARQPAGPDRARGDHLGCASTAGTRGSRCGSTPISPR